jgi:hypothetical protein
MARILAAAITVALAGAGGLPAAAHVYWNEGLSPVRGVNDHIGRANLDGTMVDTGLIGGLIEGVTGVALDGSHSYWTNDHGFIGRANLDGSGAQDTWSGGQGVSTVFRGLAVNATDFFWANTSNDRVESKPLAEPGGGSGFWITGARSPQSIALTLSYIYWTNHGGGQPASIGRADLHGTPADQSFKAVDALAVATDAGHLYWIDQSAIWRSDLDGNGTVKLVDAGCGSGAPACGIAVDGQHIYWTRYDAGAIARADLDGTNQQLDLVTGLTHPSGVAVDGARTPVPPANTAYPQISGTPNVGQTLSCSTGTWSGDPPLTYAYAWRRNGVLIEGATASAYLLVAADVNQTVQCEVTASGPGGTAVQGSGGVFVTPVQPPPPVVVPLPPVVVPPTLTPKAPAKIRVLRAGVDGGVLDMLVEITSRAATPGAKLDLIYLSSGQTTTFSVPIPTATQARGPRARAAEASIRIRRQLPAAQRKKDTGIVVLGYAGSSTVQPDNVRLRAATGKSKLTRKTAKIENGRLIVSGAITSEARGVVRIRLGYDRPDTSSAFLYWNATITNGSWKLDRTLPAEAARGGQLSIQFTGYEPRNLRGEQTAKQVLP